MMNTTIPTHEMEQAFMTKDSSYDGLFFTAVQTTGIFCRPSCSARKPLMENIRFYPTAKEALFAGFRPCLRCKPMSSHGEHPEWVSTILEKLETHPQERFRDDEIRKSGVDPARIRRYFLKHFGMTFQAYCRARRLGVAFQQIRHGNSIDEAVFDHGYDSHSGFRDAFKKVFGTPPGRSRMEDCIVSSWIESPIGPLVVGANSNGVCLLEFTDRRMLEAQLATLQKRFRCSIVPGENDHLDQLKQELGDYFSGKLQSFQVPLEFPGTPFEVSVWNQLLRIPYGETRSYEDIALEIGDVKAVRAVGRANGMNRIAIVIPCHRVVNKSGKLGGYGGGLWRKQYLLDLERSSGQMSLQTH